MVAAKAYIAALIAGIGAFASTLTNHAHPTLVGGLSAAVAGLTALSAVYATSNKAPTPPTPPAA